MDPVRRLYEIGVVALFLAVALRRARQVGARAALAEVGFGFAVSQAVEVIAVGLGRYRYPDWLVYFPPSPAWVPLGVGLGWAALLPCVMRVSEGILGKDAPRVRLAAIDGALAVGLDLVLDPAVSGDPLRLWVWRGAGMTPYRLWALGVPVFNFAGWFLLVGACGLELRALAPLRGAAWLRRAACYLALDLAIAAGVMALPW